MSKAQITLRGYTINYDGNDAQVLAGDRVVEHFQSKLSADLNESITALVQAQRWIKKQKLLEIDKGVVDPAVMDEFGNLRRRDGRPAVEPPRPPKKLKENIPPAPESEAKP